MRDAPDARRDMRPGQRGVTGEERTASSPPANEKSKTSFGEEL
jgi:hypothetical protein